MQQREIFNLNIWYQVDNFRDIAKDLKKQVNLSRAVQLAPQKGKKAAEGNQQQQQQIQPLPNFQEMRELAAAIGAFLEQMSSITNEESDFIAQIEEQ